MAVLVLVVAWLSGSWCLWSVERDVVIGVALGTAAGSAEVVSLRLAEREWCAAVWVCDPATAFVEFGLCFGLVVGVMLIVSVVSRRFSGRLKRLAAGC